MKYFWLLFSFLLFTLSVYPCSDSEECKTKSITEISESTSHTTHHHETEQCPPFCSCACCGINVFQSQNQIYSFKKDLVLYNQKDKISFYSFIYNKKIADTIWQPPKIS